MKLFIDDIRNAPNESWSVARTITSAIACISRFGNIIEEISLDHDISHQVTVGSLSRPYPCEETYQAVCHYIGLYYEGKDKRPKITLHTSNPVGAAQMKDILNHYKIQSDIKLTGMANRLEMELK